MLRFMLVRIDISENIRFKEKDSYLGVSTDDGSYKKNVFLLPRVKRKINGYAGKTDKIHSILVYHLIKNDINKYKGIHICNDVSKNKLNNNLRRLFKNDPMWNRLIEENKIRISPVKKYYVHSYIKKVREGKEIAGEELDYNKMLNYLNRLQ